MSDKPPTASRAVSQEAREAADKIRWGTPFEYSPGTTILIPPTLTESAAIIQTACVAYADRECAALKARVAELEGAQTRLLNVARGCRDYGGGHSGKDYQNFQHGIETVIRSLEAAAKRDPNDTQVNALERMGAAAAALARKEGRGT